MAYVPYSPEVAAKYTLTGPDGTVCVWNDPADANYVGMLSEVTGLDSADVRESADELVQADGGVHGMFYYGRRPITLTGLVYGHADAAARTAKLDKIRTACNAMRADAVLSWLNTAAGAIQMQTWVRRQVPLRITGAWAKTVNIGLVSAWTPLFAATATVSSTGASTTVENQGDYPAAPVIRITGNVTNPIVTNTTTGAVLKFTAGYNVPAGHYIDVDVLNHTAVSDLGVSQNQYLDFTLSTWPTVVKGNNTFTVSGGTVRVTFRSTWT